MDTCASSSVYLPYFEEDKGVNIPESECGSCAEFEERIAKIEKLLSGAERHTISKTDSSGGVITATYVGTLERS